MLDLCYSQAIFNYNTFVLTSVLFLLFVIVVVGGIRAVDDGDVVANEVVVDIGLDVVLNFGLFELPLTYAVCLCAFLWFKSISL